MHVLKLKVVLKGYLNEEKKYAGLFIYFILEDLIQQQRRNISIIQGYERSVKHFWNYKLKQNKKNGKLRYTNLKSMI